MQNNLKTTNTGTHIGMPLWLFFGALSERRGQPDFFFFFFQQMLNISGLRLGLRGLKRLLPHSKMFSISKAAYSMRGNVST